VIMILALRKLLLCSGVNQEFVTYEQKEHVSYRIYAAIEVAVRIALTV
jgi:hypothetical protein